MTMDPIPMSSPDLGQAEIDAVNEVLATRWLSFGPRLEAFEEAVAAYVGADHAVGVNSGTSGLHLAVIAAGVGEGDLVLTTPFSFIASANCALYQGAIPVFVDVDRVTGNLDPGLAVEAVEALAQVGPGAQGGAEVGRWLPPSLREGGVKGEGLRAILPIHAFGQPADMDPLLEVAQRHDLVVIEDACEAMGAEYRGRKAGTLGQVGVFAFYPNKQMTTGEGGVIVTNNEEWAELFRSLRNQGRDVFDCWLNHKRLGYNYRLDELSAALGLVQVGRLDELLEKRARVAGWYDERLAGVELVESHQVVPATTRMSWFVYVVRILPPASRTTVMERLKEQGVPSRPYFSPIHLQPFYRERFGYAPGDFPVTEYLGEVSLALPFSSVMTEEQVERVCDGLRDALAQVGS